MRSTLRRGAAVVVGAVAAALALAGCAAPMPNSVVQGSAVTVGWTEELTSANAARAGASAGDLDVAALTRSQFAQAREGEVTPDERFGGVSVVSDDPFTVRYDLNEPVWSDGIPLDVADLMLAWAAGADATEAGFEARPSGLTESAEPPVYDEFGRWIEVTFAHPVVDWHEALDVAVPAHAAARAALGIDDPMVAKQAVIDAVAEADERAIGRLAAAWNDGFAVADPSVDGEGLWLSSGPYRVESADDEAVTLVANARYATGTTPAYERIVLQRTDDVDAAAQIGADVDFDIAALRPTPDNFEAIRDLERTDHGVAVTNDGQLWTLYAATGVGSRFADPAQRAAFLRTVSPSDVVSGAAGRWDSEYRVSNTLLFPPGTDGEQIAAEDAGYASTFAATGRSEDMLAAVGLSPGVTACVLYERDDPFAAALFASLRDTVAEEGWTVTDCGVDDLGEGLRAEGTYDAVIAKRTLPLTPAEIRAQWGEGAGNLTGAVSAEREELIDRLAVEADPYAARDLRVDIERTIIDQLVARPLTMEPVVIVSARGIDGVVPEPGRDAVLTSSAVRWQPADQGAAAPRG